MAVPVVAAAAKRRRANTLRPNAYSGGSRLATAPPDLGDKPPAPARDDETERNDEGDPPDRDEAPDRAARSSWWPRGRAVTGNDGAGVVLAFLVWVWVVIPAKNGGLDGVRNVLRAKFFNQGPDGTYL